MGDYFSSLDHLITMVLIFACVGVTHILTKRMDRKYQEAGSMLSHASALRIGFSLMMLSILTAFISGLRYFLGPGFIENFNAGNDYSWLVVPLMMLLGYGVISLKKPAMIVLSLLGVMMFIGIATKVVELIFLTPSQDPGYLQYLSWAIPIIMLTLLVWNVSAAAKYLRSRWAEYR